jgi:hypothetical protein
MIKLQDHKARLYAAQTWRGLDDRSPIKDQMTYWRFQEICLHFLSKRPIRKDIPTVDVFLVQAFLTTEKLVTTRGIENAA